MLSKNRSRATSALFLYVIFGISLTACLAATNPAAPSLPSASTALPASTATSAPPATPAPTSTPPPPAGVFWVDPTEDLGEISKLVLGANHGPWSDLGPGNIEPVKVSGLTFLRWPGGSWGDENNVQSFAIDNYIAEARLMGAEPSIVVRLPNSTPQQAAALVQYVNIKKKYGVKYWSIGNEPSLYENNTAYKSLGYNAITAAQQWGDFARAMKAVDPTILLYGPDIHQFKGDPAFDPRDNEGRYYLQEFLKLNGDLVNIVTVHRYPFPTCQTCNPPSPADLFANTPEWDTLIPNLRGIVKEITGKDLPVGVTEFSSSYSNNAGSETSPDSFDSAIWLADVLGRMIRQRPEMLAYWLLKNSNAGHGLMTAYDLRPSYYVYQIYKLFGNHLLAANSPEDRVSVFASKTDVGNVTIIFVNRGESAVTKPLQLEKGDALKLTEAYVFDKDHQAEAVQVPAFKNGDLLELAGLSVTLFVFKP
jgi:hypothetical protein